jgi:hypothetical protein
MYLYLSTILEDYILEKKPKPWPRKKDKFRDKRRKPYKNKKAKTKAKKKLFSSELVKSDMSQVTHDKTAISLCCKI